MFTRRIATPTNRQGLRNLTNLSSNTSNTSNTLNGSKQLLLRSTKGRNASKGPNSSTPFLLPRHAHTTTQPSHHLPRSILTSQIHHRLYQSNNNAGAKLHSINNLVAPALKISKTSLQGSSSSSSSSSTSSLASSSLSPLVNSCTQQLSRRIVLRSSLPYSSQAGKAASEALQPTMGFTSITHQRVVTTWMGFNAALVFGMVILGGVKP
eukprot:TRINITY_DN4046_c2_g1_i1.p1 TRINITY_DN4046_c2_g1~~TRINITY_DN4046_c2_g1_i1.p1  ORF type:complete len:232 (-),score=46.55 TRINITY_DN4046_c2_g1_i1:623-1249(-)